MTEKLLILDVSAYQTHRISNVVTKHIDWDVLVSQPVRAVTIRCAISWGYVDVAYSFGKSECKRLGIPMSAYHVFYPNSDPIRQAQHFCNVAGDDTDYPLVADIELGEGSHRCTPPEYQKALKKYLDEIERIDGRKPIIYSRATFIDYYLTGSGTPPAWFNDYDWYLAQYLSNGEEHPGEPKLPKGVSRERVIIHQTSDRGNGKLYGVQSAAVDLNRWQKSEKEFLAFVGREVVQDDDEIIATLKHAIWKTRQAIAMLERKK